MNIDIEQLSAEIRDAALEELLPRFRRIGSQYKSDGSVVTEADFAVQERVTRQLRRAYPQIPLLGEEMSGDQQQRIMQESDTGYWCLDPLDGTANYVAGMPCFATSLAYIQNGRTLLGVIFDPLRDECYSAVRGQGARLNGRPLQLEATSEALKSCVAMVDFKRLSRPLAARLATQPPYRSQRSIGSVALDWCWLAAGRFQLYLHGGSKLWDYAAGTLIFSEAGGSFQLTAGSASLPETSVPVLSPQMAIAAPGETLFKNWRDWVREHEAEH
ncbi:MAG: inositol monophosphatase family protein [Candidatus Thiodiazotropha sp.]